MVELLERRSVGEEERRRRREEERRRGKEKERRTNDSCLETGTVMIVKVETSSNAPL